MHKLNNADKDLTKLLTRILSYLTSPEDIVACMQVSRVWYRAAIPLLYDSPKFGQRHSPLHSFKRFLSALSTNTQSDSLSFLAFARVAHLNLKNISESIYESVGDEWLTLILSRLQSLESLNVDGCTFVNPESVRLVGPLLKHRRLTRLDVSRCNGLTSSALVGLIGALPELSTFTAQDLQCVSSSTIGMLIHTCPQLKTLDLGLCQRVDDRALFVLAQIQSKFSNLRIAGCLGISNVGISHLSRCKGLRTLDISKCDKISIDGIRALSQPPQWIMPRAGIGNGFASKHDKPLLLALLMHQTRSIKFHTYMSFFDLSTMFPQLRYLSVSFTSIISWFNDLSEDTITRYWKHFKLLEIMQLYDAIFQVDMRRMAISTLALPRIRAVQFYRPEFELDHLLGGYCDSIGVEGYLTQSAIQELAKVTRSHGRDIMYSLNIQPLSE
ncbi:hypothetical protein H4219_000356 [Mycoemilia scoparia]|uniref:F-box domain-containing protein n=1 Tax=Mycoemilia scoparia TaxID=417184 RepID=A0A9W8A3J4_9FUNG|nr:hypothetical protein H4219_000356 [Mycoemilia scoparia]